MSNDDQLSRLSRALSTTAVTLFGSQNVEDTILSYSSPYKRALHQAMTSVGANGSLVSLNGRRKDAPTSFQSLYSSPNGKNFFSNKFTDSRTSFKVLSYISDDLLNDIPGSNSISFNGKLLKEDRETKSKPKNEKQEPSLFQGFEASLPVVNEVLEDQDKILKNSSQNLLSIESRHTNEPGNGENIDINELITLPHNLSPEKINESYSLKYLKSMTNQVVDSLDVLEIQKKVAASEIRELDNKLSKLKSMRDLVFKRIAKIEQNELILENNLNMVGERMSFLQEYGLEMDNGADTDSSTTPISSHKKIGESDATNGDVTSDSNDGSEEYNVSQSVSSMNDSEMNSPLMSRSIYRKLKQKDENPSKKLHNFYHDHNKKHRKTFPTLQQYYNRGTKITSFQKAHDDGIICLDFDVPFGTLSTAGHMDHCIKIWDLSQNKKIAQMSGHLASISCMQMDRRYNMLITGGRDAVLKMWNLNLAIQLYQEESEQKSGNESSCVYTFDSHVDEITALSFDSGNLVSGSQDRTIRQWDLTSGKCLQTIDISFAGRISQSSSLGSTTMLTPTETSPVIGALQCFDAALATGTKDGIVRLWDLRSGQIVRTLEGHTDAITALKFDSKNLVTGSLDRSVRIWDLRTGTLADAFAYDSPVLSLDFDLQNIVVATGEEAIKVVDREDGNHWDCIGEVGKDITSASDSQADAPSVPPTDSASEPSTSQFVKYKDGYTIEGRNNGDVNAWAI